MITSFFYPSYCIVCKQLITVRCVLCTSCLQALPKVPPIVHPVMSSLHMIVYAASLYEGVIAHLVQAKEFRDQKSAQQLGKLVAQYAQNNLMTYDVIIPVPLHWSRFMYRGYNQATVMAKQLQTAECGVYSQPFIRRRATPQQRLLEGNKRQSNVKNAFAVKPYWSDQQVARVVTDKKILLIDDVYTTGHTLNEFARTVARYNPAQIDALVACRVA